MTTGYSAINLITDQSAFAVVTGTIDSTTPIENVAHPHGFRTAKFAPSGGIAAFEADLGSMASRDIIGMVANVAKGTVTATTYNAVAALVETIQFKLSFPQIVQWPNRGAYVRTSLPFQTVRWSFAPATGDIDPVEVSAVWCADDVVELPDPVLPFGRDLIPFADLISERGRPLTNQTALRFDSLRSAFTDVSTFLEAWESSRFGCSTAFICEDYARTPLGSNSDSSGFIVTWDSPPRIRAVQPAAGAWNVGATLRNVPAPRYPDKYDIVAF